MSGEIIPSNPERPVSASEYIDSIVGGDNYADVVRKTNLYLTGEDTSTDLLDNSARTRMMADVPYNFTKAISSEGEGVWLPDWLKKSINQAYDGMESNRPNRELENGKAYSSIAIFAGDASGDDMSRMIDEALSELEAKGSTAKYLDILVPSPAATGSKKPVELPHSDPNDHYYNKEDLEKYIFAPRRKERPYEHEEGSYTAREAAIMAVLNYYDAGTNPDFKLRELYDDVNNLTAIDITLDPLERGDSQVVPRIIESEADDYRATFITWEEYTGWFREGAVAAVVSEQDAINLDTVARIETLGTNFNMPVLGVSPEEGLSIHDKLLSMIAAATPLRYLCEAVSTRPTITWQDDHEADAGRL